MKDIYENLCRLCGAENVKKDEPLSAHTTFRIGGPADFFVSAAAEKQLAEGTAFCRRKGIPFFVLGNGSNILAGGRGFRGVIFCTCRTMSDLTMREEGDMLLAEAGAGILLGRLAAEVAARSFTGMEFASGIPGTLGGAVVMNAGAYDGEISGIVCSARVMDPQGRIREVDNADLHFGYRHSLLMEEEGIVLSARLSFRRGRQEEIGARMADLAGRRRQKQPLEYPSAGSTFKRPAGFFAAKLIQDCGLKGYRVGDAMVSDKHSGFVVNVGSATADQVRSVMAHVQETVMDKTGVMLEPEVKLIGEF